MNQFEAKLLKAAFDNYAKTYSRKFSFVMSNSDDLFYLTEAAKYLAEESYINPLSDNIYKNKINILAELVLEFELTDKGIEYAMSLKN